MDIPVSIEGFTGHQIVVRTGGFFSASKLVIDGQPMSQREIVLPDDDGTDVTIELQQANFLDPIPQLSVGGHVIRLAEPLKWYQWVWAGLPLVLIFAGGLVGGLCGGVAAVVNGRVFRTEMNGMLKYLVTALVSAGAAVAWYVLVLAIL